MDMFFQLEGVTGSASPLPESSSLALLGIGGASVAIGAVLRGRRQKLAGRQAA